MEKQAKKAITDIALDMTHVSKTKVSIEMFMGMGLALARLWSAYHDDADCLKVMPHDIHQWALSLSEEEKKVNLQ